MIQLRAVGAGDAGLIFQAWGRHPENFTYLTARAFENLGDAERYVAGLFPTPQSQAFHIVLGADVIGIVKAAILEHRAQIGYVVHRPFAGQGFATAAVRQLTASIEKLPQVSRIWATCALDNIASARVLEKSGFQREAILKDWVTYPAHGGKPFDNFSYVKLPVRSRNPDPDPS